MLAGLRIAHRIGADQIVVQGDSQLVMEQVQGEYKARGVARNLLRKFQSVVLQRVPRLENEGADRLARIASSDQLDLKVTLEILD